MSDNKKTIETNEETPTTPTNDLMNIVATARSKARDIIRTKHINRIMTDILIYKIDLKDAEKHKEKMEMDVKTAEYELTQLDENHPNAVKIKKLKTESVEYTVKTIIESIERIDEQIVKYNEKITKYEEGIAKWNTEETKVNKYELSDLTNELLQRA